MMEQHAAPACWMRATCEARQPTKVEQNVCHPSEVTILGCFAIPHVPLRMVGWWVESVTVKLLLKHKTVNTQPIRAILFSDQSLSTNVASWKAKTSIVSSREQNQRFLPPNKVQHDCSEGALDLKGPTVVRNPRPRPNTAVALQTAVCTELVYSAGESLKLKKHILVQPDHINKAQRYHNFLMLISWAELKKKTFFSMGVSELPPLTLEMAWSPASPEEVVAQVQPVRHRLGFFHVFFFYVCFPWNRSIAKFREIHWMVWYGISIVFSHYNFMWDTAEYP